MILLRQILNECGIPQWRWAELSGYTAPGFNNILTRASPPRFRDRIEAAVSGPGPEAAAVREWLAGHGRSIEEIWEPAEGRLRERHKNIGQEIRKGLGLTYLALSPGDPDHMESPHKEAVMLTFGTMTYFKLRRNPFLNEVNAPQDIFLSEDHVYIKEMMLEAAKYNGFVAVHGEVGCGKSTMRRAVYRELVESGIQVIYPQILDKSKITASSLLDAIIMDVSEEGPKRTMEAKSRQALRLLMNRKQSGLRQVLMIEEAHLMNIQAIKHLKQIWEMEDGYERLIGVVLIGQTELGARLDESRYPQLREVIRRVTSAEIVGLSERDVARYLQHKFERVNIRPEAVFAEDAFPAIARRLARINGNGRSVSTAYPLTINNLAAKAMNLAAEAGEPAVNAGLVMGM